MYYVFNKIWYNAQTDEMLLMGLFDVTIKLPPVPAGTYELNIGHSASTVRPIVFAYLDDELIDTIDFRKISHDIGWVSDEYLQYDEDAIAENDNLLFGQGYRKGLSYINIPWSREPQRESELCLRRIITTFTTDGKSDHYLRLKNANEYDDGSTHFMIDFIELCPTHILPEYK
jgi:hypothetical protein